MQLLCKCGHRDEMHTTLENAHTSGHVGRLCVEYKDYPNYDAPYLHATEQICNCGNFVADNLLSIEREAQRRKLV